VTVGLLGTIGKKKLNPSLRRKLDIGDRAKRRKRPKTKRKNQAQDLPRGLKEGDVPTFEGISALEAGEKA